MLESVAIIQLDSPSVVLLMLSLLSGVLIVLLRHNFTREWSLAKWTLTDLRRIQKRSAEEAPSYSGIIIAQLQGVLAITTIVYGCSLTFDFSFTSINSLLLGLGFGFASLVIRLLVFFLLGRFTITQNVSVIHNALQRHISSWLSLTVGVLALLFSLRPYLLTVMGQEAFLISWGFWTIYRVWQVTATSIRSLSRLWWVIVYLCALEILPVLFIIKLIISVL
ncbi:MAG: hypothetical protein COA49_08910 [Bacteroidetes bacterium]|nr:MAG: hypothetical protein COA49_08910 [Bacteroidota bacterium]